MSIRSAFRFLSPVCLLAASLVVIGCGAGPHSLAPAASVDTLGGKVHGGPNPVVGALVTLYATTSNGYAATATALGTAVTGSDGSFTFVAPLPCTSGQQAYVTAQGGNPGLAGSGTNPNYLLMAALGPCANISASTVIFINEVTTVAAAEALRPFTNVSSLGGVYRVNVSAPANNNAAMGTCSVSGTVTTGCVAAGLSHAFANALNLVNSVSIGGVNPNGKAYAVAPSNPSSQVPQALINTLANALQGCVNSPGGTAGDGSMCGNLFAATTPPVPFGIAPSNTLVAALDVAQYPALTPTAVTALFGTVPPASYYQPTLVSAPADFSVAITYTGVTVPGTVGTVNVTAAGSGYTASPSVAFTGGGTPTTQATGIASLGLVSLAFTPNTTGTCTAPVVKITGGGTPVTNAVASATVSGGVITGVTITNMGAGYTSLPTITFTPMASCGSGTLTPSLGVVGVALTNHGAGYTSAPTVALAGTGTGAAATAGYATTSLGFPYVEAFDANDNIYIGSQNIQAVGGGVYSFYSTLESNGASVSTSLPNTSYTAPRALGVDTLGNLWVAENNTPVVAELSAATDNVIGTFTTSLAPFSLAIDKSNNVWYGVNQLFELQASNGYTNVTFSPKSTFNGPPKSIAVDQNQNIYTAGTTIVGVFPNSGTVSAPVYTSGSFQATLTGGATNALGVAMDSAGNAWAASNLGIFEVQPSGSPISGLTIASGAPFADNNPTPNYNSIDGAGAVWITNNDVTGQNVTQFVPGTNAAHSYSPCYLATGETACEVTSMQTPQRTAVDSTGAVWITSLANGRMYQILGPGTPAWPELSLTNPGVMPQ
jgi:hypothetical protein